ncbi:Fibropellin-3 [Mytilus coruscus]|uniref:Fibropellin-3 n=1 Tax=Mytilus coruscus TaxID=42192 RepID=A0A6J8DKC9_MYTCO|nr:unnamed protein product [Mytilus coruscus]CAC5408158.1 Fibropellin-3 [Mytilus coruscus]
MIRHPNKAGKDSQWGEAPRKISIEACEQYCLGNQNCESIHYESGFCFIYNQTTPTDDKDGAVYSKKNCSNTQLFGCNRCEDDLVNSCKPDTCSEYGMCQDLLGENAKCLCPITGRYTGPKCELVTDLCSEDPCGSHGKCYDYSVRYQCICEAGWTGKHCDVNINECEENPNGCLYNGTCMDEVNGYSCTCNQRFSGDRCKEKSDFCSTNPCPEGICYENYDTLNFMCKCEDPYRNNADGTCEMIPACDNVNCINGTCSNGKCDCETGFEGSLCQHNIDDCKNMPCQHGGTCTDMINSFDCHCANGYDGENCENNIDDCVGMCTGSNVDTNNCRDMLNDYQCICKAGYTGKNCSEEIDECLQQYPCEHGGSCTDKVADFECSCREGWTGKRCETPIEYCAPSPCANEGVCFNLTDGYFCRCPGGTTGITCDNSPEVCSIINPCTMKGTCQDKGGTAQCNCNDDYAGTSCQLIKDHCADPDMCNNEGQCVTKLIGFECECDESYSGSTCSMYTDPCSSNPCHAVCICYSGSTCSMYTDPCSSNPCHASAKCISNKDKYICYCEQGNLLTDTGCKVIDDNFDIFMDRYIDGMPAYLRNPIVSHTNNSMTIMFWIRVLASAGENPVLLSLEGIQIGSIPTFNPEMQQFIATSQYLLLRNSTDTDMIPYGTDVADGKWHFMVFSWEPSGKVKIFIDSIKKTDDDKMSLAFDMNEDIIMQMIIGSADTHGRISKLRIYKTVFSDIDIFKAKDSISHLPSNELKQGWTNIVLTRSTFRIVPSGAGNEKVCDLGFLDCLNEDRTKPLISCPEDQTKRGTERLTAFTDLKNKYMKNEDVKYVNTSVHDDELYIYGSSNEVFVAYDEAMNYDICRFKVYVKYADECQVPETNAVVEYCPNSKHICGLNCPSGEALSIKHNLKYRCGALGVYNFEHPRKKFILPTCGGQRTQTIALTIDISYKIVLTCTATLKDTIENDLEGKLKQDLANKWPGLVWCSGQCVWNAACSDKSMYIDVTVTLPELNQTIIRNGLTYKVKDAILIFILQEDGLNFKSVGGAELEEDSVTVDENPSCPSGYTVVGDTCVMCGKGTYRNDTTMSCEFCPIGLYQPNVGQSSCTSCQPTKTTLTYGSYSSSDCIDDCPPGQYYDAGTSNCAQCERHHYQHMSGQEFCYPCPLGKKTSEKGSNSSESCYQDCEAGTELQPDGSCKVCERGYYRTQEDDECKSCQDVKPGMTTEGEKSASVSDCRIRICYAGNFRNATTNECEVCPVGWYQSENLQDECEACPASYTTDAEGKTHRDNCTFYCDPGMEVVSADLKSCRKCPRGSYH